MPRDLAPPAAPNPLLRDDGVRLRAAAETLLTNTRVRLDRLWAYYRNPLRPEPALLGDAGTQRPYRQAQEWGLPSRITGVTAGSGVFDGAALPGVSRKEIVIENDIGWRIETGVDFLFGRPIVLNSASPDHTRRPAIESLLRRILASNGGLVFLQKLALLGAVYGQVDVLVKFTPDTADVIPTDAGATQLLGDTDPAAVPADGTVTSPGSSDAGPAPAAVDAPSSAAGGGPEPKQPGAIPHSQESLERLARMIRFEIVDPTRALPLLDPADCRRAEGFAVVYQLDRPDKPQNGRPAKWWQNAFSRPFLPQNAKRTMIELTTETAWTIYDDGTIVAGGNNTLGRLPLVHIQNIADPLRFEGTSDVEPLIPLQDELNTRLSDRAHRIALQSFKMYLGKGIENFAEFGVAPGRMWSSENPDADVIELGGDANCPSEDNHIADVREALDKLSGVSPVAAGAIKGKIGNLTSAEALRVTMMALLSRTERKRTTYGTAISQLCELALAWLDHAGLFATTAADRAVQLHWPSPMPNSEAEQLALAKAKAALGVPKDVVLRELGYGDSVPSPGNPGEG